MEDTAGALFTAEDRRQATAAGLHGTDGRGSRGRRGSDEGFLVRRSDFAFARMATRVPALAHADRHVCWPAWIGWALPGLALVLGVATNEIGGGGRLNIIAFPLMGMLAWNLVVYGALFAAWLRRLGRGAAPDAARGPFARALGWAIGRALPAGGDGTVAARAIAQFVPDWLSASSALTQARISRTLHLAAAALATGVLLGMYARALGVEYRAGWESTFIDAETLHRVVGVVLAPASRLTGVALPDVAQLEAIRWRPGRPGENAGRWIHLFATTATLFIIGPRLLLAGWEALRAWRLAGRLPAPGREDFYVRRLLRDARDVGALVRVIPYSFHLPPETGQRLRRLLTAVLGDRARVTLDAPIAYGGEDDWLGALTVDPEVDHVLVLFNLSATPETETHGDVVERLRGRLDEGGGGPALSVIVDESAYRQRLAGQAGSAQRLEARRLAWNAVLGRAGVTELAVDLASDDEAALTRQLEGALMHEPALTAAEVAR